MTRLYCFVCNSLFSNRQLSRLSAQSHDLRTCATARRLNSSLPEEEENVDSRICLTCRNSIQEELEAITQDPSHLRLNVAIQGHAHACFICSLTEGTYTLSVESRVDVYIQQEIYVPPEVKSCQNHFNERGFIHRFLLPGIRYFNKPYIMRGYEMQTFMQAFRNVARTSKSVYEENLCDEDFTYMTSLSKAQFNDLLSYCDPVEENGFRRKVKRKDLLMFLCKMRQGISDDFLKVIFDYTTRQAVSLAVSTVRRSLMLRLVPDNLGFNAINRQEYIERHVTEFANQLYNPTPQVPRVIAYMDGTYAFTEKNSNHRVLRQTFSSHKTSHLIKPVLVVAPNGYILQIQGPYFSDSRNNDASILNNEFDRDAQNMNEWFQDGDIMILDRGYRDSIPLLISKVS